MYTEDNMEDREYEDNYEESNENKNSIWTLLLRIIIILLCVLLFIWILSRFIGGDKTDKNDGTILNNNLNAIRLSAEKYFFMQNNLPQNENDTITLSLLDMNNKNLVSEIKDYQGNVCAKNANESFATLKKTNYAYILTVKLTCDSEQKEVTYYYDLKDYECLSCNGNTYMDGNNNNQENSQDDKQDNQGNENDAKNDEIIANLNINCNTWSPWTSIKIDDSHLLVKTRTLYKGKKTTVDGVKITYGPWSAFSETPIAAADNLEVETKDEVVTIWSDNKTTTDYIANTDSIKVISATTTGSEKECHSSEKKVREKVSASKYQSLNKQGLVVAVHDTYYEKECTTDCETCYKKVYDITYKKKTTSCTGGNKVTTYTYQELTSKTVKMYRSRAVIEEQVKGETVYTDWVEKLEEGYIKTEEKTEYSYKDTVCKG